MDRDDERLQMLLGKHLLGKATEGEVRELRARRDADAAFREAMDFAERSAGDYRRSAAGEDVRVSPAHLPDWLRPQELARGLEGWFWRWLWVSAGSAVCVLTLLSAALVNLAPGSDPGRSAMNVHLPAAVAFASVVIAAWFARQRLAERIASGGPSWDRTVAAVKRQERWFLSPLGTTLLWLGAGAAAAAVVAANALHGRDAGERKRLVDEALSALPPDHRMVLALVVVEGLSQTDVAELLGVAEGTVWSRYARARVALAREFERRGLASEDLG